MFKESDEQVSAFLITDPQNIKLLKLRDKIVVQRISIL
jgi:hypothetical protein